MILDDSTIENLLEISDLLKINNNYEIEYTLKQLKGRKKSTNITFSKRKDLLHGVCPDILNFDKKLIIKRVNEAFCITNFDSEVIAQQLTLISHNLYSKIDYLELLNACWTKKNKNIAAPNIMKLIERFNTFTLWILEEILSYDRKVNRVKVLEKFIRVADECRKLNNFNDCVNITSALNNYIMKKLKKTWKMLNSESVKIFNSLNEFCSYDKNYLNLRTELDKCKNKPCVPYLGILLKDLAFLEEGQKYIKDDYLINIHKILRVAKTINIFDQFKTQVYFIKSDPELFVLYEPSPKTEDELEAYCNKLGK